MVDSPADYHWSSYQSNALGKSTSLWTPHDTYLKLGTSDDERQAAYRELFLADIDGSELDLIRAATNKGLAIGSDRFKQEVERLSGRRVSVKKQNR